MLLNVGDSFTALMESIKHLEDITVYIGHVKTGSGRFGERHPRLCLDEIAFFRSNEIAVPSCTALVVL